MEMQEVVGAEVLDSLRQVAREEKGLEAKEACLRLRAHYL